jgi:hypothetical protein
MSPSSNPPPNLRFSQENVLIVSGQSRPVNHGSLESLNGLGQFQPRELYKLWLGGSRVDCSTLRQNFGQQGRTSRVRRQAGARLAMVLDDAFREDRPNR